MARPKIGLALGSGASRGLAHIGVLKAFEDAGIPVDMVAGTSAGALIGALYLCGNKLDMMARIARNLPRKDIFDLTVPKIGFIKGNRVEELIKLLTRGMKIEELPIPFRAVAADISMWEKVVFDKGPIHRAVRASISIPGIFVPVYYENRVLVDGGILDRIPVGVVREMGADIAIGVDVGFSGFKGKVDSIFDVLFRSIDTVEREVLKGCITDADILIKPYLPNIDPSRFDQVDECYAEGYEAASHAVPRIKQMIKEMTAA